MRDWELLKSKTSNEYYLGEPSFNGAGLYVWDARHYYLGIFSGKLEFTGWGLNVMGNVAWVGWNSKGLPGSVGVELLSDCVLIRVGVKDGYLYKVKIDTSGSFVILRTLNNVVEGNAFIYDASNGKFGFRQFKNGQCYNTVVAPETFSSPGLRIHRNPRIDSIDISAYHHESNVRELDGSLFCDNFCTAKRDSYSRGVGYRAWNNGNDEFGQQEGVKFDGWSIARRPGYTAIMEGANDKGCGLYVRTHPNNIIEISEKYVAEKKLSKFRIYYWPEYNAFTYTDCSDPAHQSNGVGIRIANFNTIQLINYVGGQPREKIAEWTI